MLQVIPGPNKTLNTSAALVGADEFGDSLESLLSNMAVTMYTLKGVGLAGNQVGVLKRIIVADVGEKYGTNLVKLVNPEIIETNDILFNSEEGCLSLPGFEFSVKRHGDIIVDSFDAHGNKQRHRFRGYPAAIIQHEIDHLNGITLLEKSPRNKKKYIKKMKKLKRQYPSLESIFPV